MYTCLVDEGSLELRVASIEAASRLHQADKQVQGPCCDEPLLQSALMSTLLRCYVAAAELLSDLHDW